MPRRSPATSAGTTRISAIASARRAATSLPTGATRLSSCRNAWSIDTAVTWGDDRPPRARRGRDTVIYEAHVKGMTAARHDIPEQLRGTFAGFADPRVIDHLVRLGVTAVELMPIQAFFDDRNLVEKKLVNYWGYNTINYFSLGAALHLAAARDVARIQGAGAPPARGRHRGDPRRRLQPHRRGQPSRARRSPSAASTTPATTCSASDKRFYFDTTGCRQHGQPAPSARAADGHGFAPLLGRGMPRRRLPLRPRRPRSGANTTSFDTNAAFFDAVRQDPVLSRVQA